MPNKLLSSVDHLVYAAVDLDEGIDDIDCLTGIRARYGGQHPGLGTRNALAALGPLSYLEIIAPDPGQPPPQAPRPFGIDSLNESRLAGWCAKGKDLDHFREEAVRHGVPLGEVLSMSRRRPDGVVLAWRLTDLATTVADGIVPFFIDWGESFHPSRTAIGGLSLVDLRAEHPDADRVEQMLRQLGLDLPVEQGSEPALVAIIDGPYGRMELR
ncbi:MAG: VOC family protein [Thermoguttaceae bacterium]